MSKHNREINIVLGGNIMHAISWHFFYEVFRRQRTILCRQVTHVDQNSQHIVIGYRLWRNHLSCVFCANTQRSIRRTHKLQPSRRRWKVLSFLHYSRSQCGLSKKSKITQTNDLTKIWDQVKTYQTKPPTRWLHKNVSFNSHCLGCHIGSIYFQDDVNLWVKALIF